MVIRIHRQSVGRPQTISDWKGRWRSAIFRRPVEIGFGGLAGYRNGLAAALLTTPELAETWKRIKSSRKYARQR